jgi:pimeloyl-ACP methyl ester carboxylesterase
MTALTGDNATVIKALSHDGKTVLIGHDWGAPIVYATAYTKPEVVRAVVGLWS